MFSTETDLLDSSRLQGRGRFLDLGRQRRITVCRSGRAIEFVELRALRLDPRLDRAGLLLEVAERTRVRIMRSKA
ncbi:hypothetical protein D9M71_701940 [compost metagenome]